jgi:hypothetical protein
MLFAADFSFEPPLGVIERLTRSDNAPRSDTARRGSARDREGDSLGFVDRRCGGAATVRAACVGTETTIGGTPEGVGDVLALVREVVPAVGVMPIRCLKTSIRVRRSSSRRSEATLAVSSRDVFGAFSTTGRAPERS